MFSVYDSVINVLNVMVCFKLSLYLRDNIELLKNEDRVVRVLNCLCEKMMKQRETNEILALKFSYLSYVVKQTAISYKSNLNKSNEKEALEPWIR